jgi:type II secretory pathway component PulC
MSPGGSKIPPEEKLLKLIRGKPQAESSAMPGARGAGTVAAVGSAGGGGWGLPGWLVPTLNVVLSLVAAAEIAALVWCFVAPVPEVSLPAAVAAKAADEVPVPEAPPSLSAAASRPLFEAPDRAPESAQATPAATAGPSVEARELASRLTLIGVVSGDSPQAIIEDSGKGKTSFVGVGQMVEGMVVEEVHDNRVVLSLNGERVELSL